LRGGTPWRGGGALFIGGSAEGTRAAVEKRKRNHENKKDFYSRNNCTLFLGVAQKDDNGKAKEKKKTEKWFKYRVSVQSLHCLPGGQNVWLVSPGQDGQKGRGQSDFLTKALRLHIEWGVYVSTSYGGNGEGGGEQGVLEGENNRECNKSSQRPPVYSQLRDRRVNHSGGLYGKGKEWDRSKYRAGGVKKDFQRCMGKRTRNFG